MKCRLWPGAGRRRAPATGVCTICLAVVDRRLRAGAAAALRIAAQVVQQLVSETAAAVCRQTFDARGDMRGAGAPELAKLSTRGIQQPWSAIATVPAHAGVTAFGAIEYP